MAFVAPKALQAVPEEEKPKYQSGYTEEEELIIKEKKKQLDLRDLSEQPVTLEEFRDIVCPWFRIHRTEQFTLHPEKVKAVRVPKEPKPKVEKVPKEKKLTKAQTTAKMQGILMKMATKVELTEEEQEFFKVQTGG